jgi:hypothetical protein
MTDNREPSPPAAAPGLADDLELAATSADLMAWSVNTSGFDDLIALAREAAAALRTAAPQAGEPGWATLCVECGPNVRVDEDGCCLTCGNGAVGTWLYRRGAPSGGAEQGGSDGE